ncbi:MAG: glycosyltransferase family 2 protein, partial [Terracidiphilus sp.]
MQVPISVIIPHYNRPDRIGRAIASVRAQTLQPAEIVLVDDCSKPQCREELKRFESAARIVWLSRNGGLANTRNEGARASQYETIAFLDDDDEWLPEKLAKQWALLEANHGLAASTTASFVIDTNTGALLDVIHVHSAPSITLPMALEATPAMVATLVIRKSAFLAIGGFDSAFRYLEDQDFLIRLAASGMPNGHLAEPLFRYHLGGADHLSAQ